MKYVYILRRYALFLIAMASLACITGASAYAQSWSQEATQGGFWIKKVVSDTSIASGQPFSYTIYYSLPAGASNVTINDNLPPGAMFLSASYSNACGIPSVNTPVVNQMGGLYSLSWPTIPNSCSGSLVITVAFPNGTTCPGTSVRNNVCLQGTIAGKVYEFCTGYVLTKATAVNPWNINKYPLGTAWQGGACPYATGSDTITWQVYVYKDFGTTGQLNLVNGIVRDTLPTGAVLVSSSCGATQSGNVITWNVGNLPATSAYNATACNFTVYYPPSQFPQGSQITNSATLSGQTGSPNQPCDSFAVASNKPCVQLVSLSTGSISKWVYTNRQPGCAGQYLLYFCNTGTTTLITTVRDTLPTQLSGYSLGYSTTNAVLAGNIVTILDTLTPGQCAYVYINFTIPLTATVNSTITNCAHLTASGIAPATACASFVVDAPAPPPCLWKEVCNKQTSYAPGSIYRYRLRIQNIGGQALTGATITDVLDPNLIYIGNPSYYTSSTWNTPCTTTSNWTGVSLLYNSGTNTVMANISSIPAVCQNIFYSSCGMYGTSGVPYYFIEFDVKVADTAAMGNIPNSFTLGGGNLGTVIYPSNTDLVLVTGTIGFSLDKGVKKPADTSYSATVTASAGGTVDYRLKMLSTGTAALRYVSFADLLPRDAVTADQKILQMCGLRGSQFDVTYSSLLSSSPTSTPWNNPFNTGLANVNNFQATGSPGFAFNIGCGTGGSWASGWTAGDRNLGAHFGSAPIVTGCKIDFAATVSTAAQPQEVACNSFAASGFTKHLIQSNIVSFQLAGQSESQTACITVVPGSTGCIEKVISRSIKCIGKNSSGNYEYSIQIVATSCAPATMTITSPDGNLTPSSFSFASSPWTLNTTFEHTSANNPMKIYYTLTCNGNKCTDSTMFDLPDCPPDTTPPIDCCAKFIHNISDPKIVWSSAGGVSFSAGMTAGPAQIKKFSVTIVSAQLRPQTGSWTRIFGDITGGTLVVAPAPGPQLLSLFSREAIWGTGECIDWNKGANLTLSMIFPGVSIKYFKDTLLFALRYSFTDCDCHTCDTVAFYKIVRNGKILPWDGTGNPRDIINKGEIPLQTGIVMSDYNSGSLWVINPGDKDNDIVVLGAEVSSPDIALTTINYNGNYGKIKDNVGYVDTKIDPGSKAEVQLGFINKANVWKIPLSVRYTYKMLGSADIFTTDAMQYYGYVYDSKPAPDLMDIDKNSKPDGVHTFAIYVSNSNGRKLPIKAIRLAPQDSAATKIIAVGPPASDKGRVMIMPQILPDGSYVVNIPPQSDGGYIDPDNTFKPVFMTLSGVNLSKSAINFTTYDDNMQAISSGSFPLSNPISAVENEGASGSGVYLNLVAPNPARNNATISFIVYEPMQDVTMTMTDETGHTVRKIISNARLNPGNYIEDIDTGSLPSGSYLITLITNKGMETRKLVVIK